MSEERRDGTGLGKDPGGAPPSLVNGFGGEGGGLDRIGR